MARVARRAGQRGRTIPAPPRTGCGAQSDSACTVDPPAVSCERGHWGGGLPTIRETSREGSEQMRRTAAAIAAGALVLLTGCNADDNGGTSAQQTSAAQVPPAQVSLAPADGATDVAPSTPLEITVTDGELGKVTVADAAGTTVPGKVEDGADASAADVWVPEEPLAYST